MNQTPELKVNNQFDASFLSQNIIYKGRLPNSSYNETLQNKAKVSAATTSPEATSGMETVPESTTTSSPSVTLPTNLDRMPCAFSPDGTQFAWSCGFGIVKLAQWKNGKMPMMPRLRSSSFLVTTPIMPSPQQNQLRRFSLFTSPLPTIVAKTPSTTEQSPVTTKVELEEPEEDIIELDCGEGEMVSSIEFGSSISYVKHRRHLHCVQPRVNNRFDLQHSLILAVGLNSGKIRIYDGITAEFLFILTDHKESVNGLKFTKDGSLQLASVSNDETCKLWNMFDDGNMYKTLWGHIGPIHACDWSPTASLLCTVGVSRQVFLWDTQTYTLKQKLTGHLHDVVSCEFSPDGALLATASYDTKILIWDPYTGEIVKQFYHLLPPPRLIYASGHNGFYVQALKFSSNGDHLISICDDKKLRVWSMSSRSLQPYAICTHNDSISLAYSTNTRTVMAGTKSGYIDVYQVPLMLSRLVDICRRVVNQYVDHESINRLKLPGELKHLLLYDNVKEQANQTIQNNQQPNYPMQSPIQANS